MSFPFRRIKSTFSPKQASEQYEQLLKLDYDENGNLDPERAFDALRVAEALSCGRIPSRAEVRERVKKNELAFAHETDEEARDRYAASLGKPL
jgi:hypothetical protein